MPALILNGKATPSTELLDAFAHAVPDELRVITEGPGDATRAAAQLQTDILWIAGGDGTIHEAIQGLMQRPADRRPTVGILPLGTANDMARGLGLLDVEPLALFTGTVELTERPIDLATWGDRYVANQVTIGLPAAVTAETAQPLKDALGGLAYTLEGITRVLSAETFPVRVQGDDGPVCDEDVLMLGVAVGPFGGGGIPVHPEADFDGSCLHIVVVPAGPSLGRVVRARLPTVNLDIPASTPVNLDGEPTDERPADIRCVAGALRVLVPVEGGA